MNFVIILLLGVAVKFLISLVLYRKNRHVLARMSLPAKGAVIGSGWLVGYGVFHFLEAFI